jgi:hypothetical protein
MEPCEPKPSALTQLTEGAKDIYRRLSGKKKVNTHNYQHQTLILKLH